MSDELRIVFFKIISVHLLSINVRKMNHNYLIRIFERNVRNCFITTYELKNSSSAF